MEVIDLAKEGQECLICREEHDKMSPQTGFIRPYSVSLKGKRLYGKFDLHCTWPRPRKTPGLCVSMSYFQTEVLTTI